MPTLQEHNPNVLMGDSGSIPGIVNRHLWYKRGFPSFEKFLGDGYYCCCKYAEDTSPNSEPCLSPFCFWIWDVMYEDWHTCPRTVSICSLISWTDSDGSVYKKRTVVFRLILICCSEGGDALSCKVNLNHAKPSEGKVWGSELDPSWLDVYEHGF